MAFDFSNSKQPLTAFSMAGLTDIVLLLLIFFLLTSSFIPQFGIQVTLPEAQAAAPMEDQYVSVAITDDGRFYVNQDLVPREQLLDVVREVRGTRTALVIRADERATVGQLAAVANLARALDMRVLMATERRDLSPLR